MYSQLELEALTTDELKSICKELIGNDNQRKIYDACVSRSVSLTKYKDLYTAYSKAPPCHSPIIAYSYKAIRASAIVLILLITGE